MIYDFRLPLINPHMSGATIEYVHCGPAALKAGNKLLDISVDLGSAFAQECPPISFYRLVMRENAWLREINLTPGQYFALGDLIAVFSSDPEESLDQPVTRGVRVTIAGIMHNDGMWTGGNH
jgi:hypothetical protein